MWKRLNALVATMISIADSMRRSAFTSRWKPRKNIRLGMSPEDARLKALRSFGPMEKHKEEARDARGVGWIETLVADLRYGGRALLKHPGYAVLAVLTLGLGIGANTAIFSVINGVLLKPLPYEHGERLVVVQQSAPLSGRRNTGVAIAEYFDYRERAKDAFDGLVEYHQMNFDLINRGEPDRVNTGVVSANFFDLLGIKPVIGRTFVAADDVKGAEAVLVLSHTYWQTKFGGDPNIVGQVFEMNDRPHRVIGVLPNVPHYPQENDVYMPVLACPFRAAAEGNIARNRRAFAALNVFGRLKPGVSAEQAASTVGSICHNFTNDKAFAQVYRPEQSGFQGTVVEGARCADQRRARHAADPAGHHRHDPADRVRERRQPDAGADARPRSRAGDAHRARRRPRPAGPAAPHRKRATRGLRRHRRRRLRLRNDRHADAIRRPLHVTHRRNRNRSDRPHLHARRVDRHRNPVRDAPGARQAASTWCRRSSRAAGQTGESRGRKRMQGALIVAQVAVSVVLLVGAGLLLASFYRLQRVETGYRSTGVLAAQVYGNFSKYPNADALRQLYLPLIDRLQSQPGVTSVAITNAVPLAGGAPGTTRFDIEGRVTDDPERRPTSDTRIASSKYFETIGIPLVSGRVFSDLDTDESNPVIVINKSMAKYWDGTDPVGSKISTDRGEHWFTVVGVVGDVRQFGLAQETVAQLYVPLTQTPQGFAGQVLVRTTGDPTSFANTLRNTVHLVDSTLPVEQVQTLDDLRSEALAAPRLTATLLAIFAALALLVTLAGIGGVIATSVTQRTKEFGLRMALGAGRDSVLTMVIRQGLSLVVIGLAVGVAGALVAGRVLNAYLYQTAPRDPIIFAGVAALFILCGIIACLIPARRATTVDPLIALRAE
jgi:hypothetical protein